MLHYLFPVQVYLTKIETEKKSFSLKRLSESLFVWWEGKNFPGGWGETPRTPYQIQLRSHIHILTIVKL